MKKLLLTSSAFTGQIQVVYFQNQLVLFDVQHAEMTAPQIEYLKRSVPVLFTTLEEFIKAFNSKTLVVIEEGFTIGFEEFWSKYGQKRNKDRCVKIWEKLPQAEQVKAYAGISVYKNFLQKNTWRTIAEPEKYLKEKYWNSEWK